VESVLRLNLPELKDRLSQIVESVSAKEFVFSFATWPKKRLDPVVEEWVKRQALDILAEASQEGIKVLTPYGGPLMAEHSLQSFNLKDDLTDLASSLGPVAAGFFAMPTVAASSVASVGGFFGMLGFTAIVWPVVLVGGAMIASSLAFGATRALTWRKRANDRFLSKLNKNLDGLVFGLAENDLGEKASLTETLQAIIRETAREQLRPVTAV
jgi:hypothetical protein